MKKRGLLLLITSAALLLFAGCSDNTTQLESGNQQEESSQSITQENSSTQSSSPTNASAQNSSNTTSKQLSLNEIIALYQKNKPNTDITDIDIELSKTYWEVKVEKNGQQTDISIDAQSGNVLEVEVDD